MFAQIIHRINLKRFINAQLKCLPVVILVLAAQIHQANAQDLVLRDTTITTTAIFSASNSISAGPHFTITSSGDVTLIAPKVALKPWFFIIHGGKLDLVSQTTLVDVETKDTFTPDKFIVLQNYPNPFNPTTTIEFAIPVRSAVDLRIFDMLGREVAKLVDKELQAGTYKVAFEAEGLPSGEYFIRIKAGSYSATKKATLIR